MRHPLTLSAFAVAATTVMLVSCQSAGDAGTPDYHFVDTAQLSSSVSPGDDFFSYANQKWMDTVKIASTQMGAGSFFDLIQSTNAHMRSILDSVSKSNNQPGSIEQKVGDMYASGMDTVSIDKKGAEPIQPIFRQIDSIRDTHGIVEFVANAQRRTGNEVFPIGIGPDDKNAMMNIAILSQGGLGLPDRDYYFKTDSPTLRVVQAYRTMVTQLFQLTGEDAAAAAVSMEKAYGLEKQLAAASRTRVQLRDPQSNYHKITVAAMDKSMPALAWSHTLATMGLHTDSVNLQQPEFYTKVNQLLKTVPLDVWKDYLKAHELEAYSSRLSNAFADAQFAYLKAITGQQRQKPRAERMAQMVDATLGEALGQIYVKQYFPPEAKKRMLELVDNLQKAFAARIDKLDWMSDATKKTAKEKLFAFIKKIGYPDKWRDYSKVNIVRDDYFGNRLATDLYEYNYQLAKLGKPVDRTEWGMTPATINAYYNQYFNEIVFPAGILQPPFFDPAADDAVNYGGIGAVIGHEMTHGFDDQGAQYDKDGNLKNWWQKEDSVKFAAKTKSVVELYNSFTVLDTLHLNGALTNGENIGDMGGLAVAYDAFKLTPEGHDSTKIDGFTPDQRFFLSFSRIWRIKEKDELVRSLVATNEHSPEKWRVNGPLMNFVPFYTAFHVEPGQRMYRPDSTRIAIW